MKLYATVTSERASKGQGGNDYLEVDFTVINKDKTIINLATVKLREEDGEYILDIWKLGQDEGESLISYPVDEETKGKKKKGDIKCEYHGVNNCSRCYPHLK